MSVIIRVAAGVSAMILPVLLLSLTCTLAASASPGDESGDCSVPEYAADLNVLMDSWRYTALLDDSTAVWATETSDNDNDNAVSPFIVACIIYRL